MWFHLNNTISILTPLGETDRVTIMNGIGQGSFAATLASSLNIGCGVESITKGVRSANIGELELNSLIFQDDIAKMNYTMEDARKGAIDVSRLLESKQLQANTSKSKFVVISSRKSRTERLKDAEINPIMMGTMVIENSKSEKYLGDQIHEDGCEASITATLNGRIPGAISAGEDIINGINHPAIMGHKMEYAAVEQTSIPSLTKGTPTCMIRLDSQTLHIRYQIIMKKIKQIRKTMDKENNNICKNALVQGQSTSTCAGGDLLNECKEWCKNSTFGASLGEQTQYQKRQEQTISN